MKTSNSIIRGLAFKTGVALIALAGAAQMAKANITFSAANTGNVTGYFLSSDAGDTDLVGMLVNVPSGATQGDLTADIGALTASDFYLDNHASAPGDSAVLGSVTAGDSLVFVLKNTVTGKYILSDSALNDTLNGSANTGGYDYIATSAYAGSIIAPAGTQVNFEDLLKSEGSDLDRNDLEFVFQNISLNPPTAAVPEPTTVVAGALLLLPFGVSTLRILRNRKMAAR
ncbi:MAG TPA: PEP-CTERM sorting domain-containing protein [Verrucomicrobiae bacterium]|jgi:hypothetical protein